MEHLAQVILLLCARLLDVLALLYFTACGISRLARFKVPRYVEFVPDFPRTPSERISKPALKARAKEFPGVTHSVAARRSQT